MKRKRSPVWYAGRLVILFDLMLVAGRFSIRTAIVFNPRHSLRLLLFVSFVDLQPHFAELPFAGSIYVLQERLCSLFLQVSIGGAIPSPWHAASDYRTFSKWLLLMFSDIEHRVCGEFFLVRISHG